MWKKVSNTTAAIKTMQESNAGGSAGDGGGNAGESTIPPAAPAETSKEVPTADMAGEAAKEIAIVVTKCSDEGGSSGGADGPKTKVIFPSQDSTDTANEANNNSGNQNNNSNLNRKQGEGATSGSTGRSSTSGATLTTTESTQEDEAAPFNTILDFLSSLLTKNYKEALRLSKNILKYEPHNKTVAEFLNVLEEVVAGGLLEDTSDSSSSSASSSESDSSGSSGNSSSSSSDSDSSDADSDDGENDLEDRAGGARTRQFGIEDLESILTATTCSCKKSRHHHRHGSRVCSGRRINSANTICTTITSSSTSTGSSKSSSSSSSTTTASAATTATSCGRALLRNVESRLNSAQIRRCLLASPSSQNADAVMKRALWAVAEASTLESAAACCEEQFHHGVITGSPQRLLHDCNDCLSSVSTPDTCLMAPPPAGAYCLSRDASSESSTSTDCCPSVRHAIHSVHPVHAFHAGEQHDFHPHEVRCHSQVGHENEQMRQVHKNKQSNLGAHACLQTQQLQHQQLQHQQHQQLQQQQYGAQGCNHKGRGGIQGQQSQQQAYGMNRHGGYHENQCQQSMVMRHNNHGMVSGFSGNSPEFQTPPVTPSSPLKSILKTSNNSQNCYQHKHKFYPDEVRFDDSLLPNTASSSSSSSSCSGETTDDGYSS